ncbi:MAG TPA: Mur ligase domain-containing protein [Candidatus Saccharimonadales bacterium]|nr:Mur ligase domain-containing protein [Candidatus Saccharimonadales bacterium]
MHIYFSGIGGSGISSTALLAKQAGFEVSGSDKQDGTYTQYLRKQGIDNITIGQSYEQIAAAHQKHPIDWLVYTSALSMEQSDAPELRFCKDHDIKTSKRDKFLNMLLEKKRQKLIAIAGTHGKSTTTAMVVWLCTELTLPISYALGAKINFGDLSAFNPKSEYFVYECDEFDRNFLAFKPYVSAITGLSWDHHEIFPTLENYNQAFRDFISQTQHTIAWQSDLEKLQLNPNEHITILDPSDPSIDALQLAGRFNREDAWLAMQAVATMTGKGLDELIPIINRFPGLKQRMELLAPNLYTNYAHTPEKIRGGMNAALELAKAQQQDLVIIYEPLTNRRQHYIKAEYKDCFQGAKKLYWIPSYLARENPDLPVLTPEQLIPYLSDPSIAEPAKLDNILLARIREHLTQGDLVVTMGASGKGSLDEWLRHHFAH